MSLPWEVAFIALWMVALLQTALVLVLYRQAGLVYLGQSHARSRDGLQVGVEAPSWEAPDQHGNSVRLEDFRGRVLVLAFADPGCGPCRKFLPELEEFHVRHGVTTGVACIASPSEFENRKMAKEFGLTMPVVSQYANAIGDAYRVVATPFVYVVDEEGHIRERGIVNFRTQIEDMLAGLDSHPLPEGVQA